MMTPLTLIIDRTFRGVGRIKKATGTTNPVVRRKMSRMLTELYETGRLDLLRDIRDNRRTLLEVLDAHQRKALDAMATGATAETLADAMRRWIDKQQPDVDYSGCRSARPLGSPTISFHVPSGWRRRISIA